MRDFDATAVFLEKVQRHTRLTEEECQAFIGMSKLAYSVAAGTDIVRRREYVNSTCLVVEGLLARTFDTVSGDRQIAAFYVPGEMPDVHAAMITSATATLHAVSATRVVRMPRPALTALLRQYPALAEALWRETIIDAIISMEWTANVGQREALPRMAHLFAEMAVRSRAVSGNRFKYALPATQTNLAEATGMTSVHVSRTLQALRAANLADFDGREVFVHDWQGLTAVGEFDDSYLLYNDPQRLLG